MGGDFQLESHPDSGTSISVVLPVHRQEEVSKKFNEGLVSSVEVDAALQQIRQTGRSILVVDDEVSLRCLATENIEYRGVVAESAANGADAVRMVHERSGEYAAIVMDLLMPQMDGAQATKLIRDDYPDIPIILATGFGTEMHIKEALIAGVDAVLRKPFDYSTLMNVIARSYVNHSQKTKG